MEITNFDDNTTYIHNYTSLDSVYEPAKTVIQVLESENLSDKLDRYYRYVKSTVLNYQSAATGLFPTKTVGNCNKAKVRDCLYCAAGVWAVALAYRRIDDDKGRTYELEYSAIKCMRGILYCYMRQADKVESFKNNPSPSNCLHSVFNVHTGDELLSYDAYGHLQIDAVSLFLLYLVEMISSGLQIIYNTDEVSFIQNLVFCVERSYRRPDYGMWERGSKYNNGSTELHSSSVGMAKAALEAINGFNLFGNQGCSWSVIFVDFDAHNRNRQTLCSLLPRESRSHNTDAALLPCITYPAFAVDDDALLDQTLEKVIRKLKGRYGLKRFSRDGYRTGLEDHSRRYYKPAEIKLFDGIECEFPLFYIYLAIDGVFRGKPDEVKKYMKLLEPLVHQSYEGFALVPKYYYVPADFIELERESPGSQKRFPSSSGRDGNLFLWGQALYIIAKLLVDELISPQDVDPCRRYIPPKEQRNISLRYSNQGLSENDVVVHVSLIAESQRLQVFLSTYGIQTQTPQQVEPIQIWPQQELVKAYLHLGVNKKLKLSGRPNRPIGCIGTSKLYRILGKTIVCYPIVFDLSDFYMAQDVMLLIDDIKNLLLFIKQYWKMNRRPLFLVLIREDNIKGSRLNPILDMLAAFKNGNVGGVKVHVDRLQTLISGAMVEQLDFLRISDEEEIPQFISLEELEFPKHSRVKRKPSLAADTDLVEHLEINLDDWMFSSTSDILHKLSESSSLTSQAMLLSILLKREGPNFITGEGTVIDRLEKIYQRSGSRKHWLAVRYSAAFLELVAASIAPNITSLLVHGKQLFHPADYLKTLEFNFLSNVRFTASILGKQVDSLAPSITRVLVQGKQVTIGVFGQEEEVISNPLSPAEIKNIVFNKCAKHDVRDAVLQQELVIHIGWLISNSPELFYGMLKLRIGWIIHAMKHALKVRGEDLPTDYLYQMSPSDVKKLLLDVLQSDEMERSWLNRRHLDGSLNRTPKGFYDRVWQILERTPEGIKVTGKHLPQQPTLSDMTMYEMNFSLLVEDTLQDIVQPEYRQIIVELLMVVSAVLERNPELEFAAEVNLDNLVKSAFDNFKDDKRRLEHVEIKDMTNFYNTPPLGIRGTASYLMKAVMNTLLEGEVRSGPDDPCVIS